MALSKGEKVSSVLGRDNLLGALFLKYEPSSEPLQISAAAVLKPPSEWWPPPAMGSYLRILKHTVAT